MKQGPAKIKGEGMEQKIVTPIGLAKFPKLSQPDKTFDKEHGTFSVDLVLNEKEAESLRSEIDSFSSDALEHMKKLTGVANMRVADSPLRRETDQEGNETGNYVIKIKAKAQFIKHIPVFDKEGNPFADNVNYGSKIQVSASLASYKAQGKFGVTVRLNAVRLLELGESSSGTAKSFFGSDAVDSSDL